MNKLDNCDALSLNVIPMYLYDGYKYVYIFIHTLKKNLLTTIFNFIKLEKKFNVNAKVLIKIVNKILRIIMKLM